MADPKDVIEGWDAIAAYVRMSRTAAYRAAHREKSPLPVYLYDGTRVLAFAPDLDKWIECRTLPLQTAEKLKRLERNVRANARKR